MYLTPSLPRQPQWASLIRKAVAEMNRRRIRLGKRLLQIAKLGDGGVG